ncbi:TolC family protein [Arenimonas alkanexedens]
MLISKAAMAALWLCALCAHATQSVSPVPSLSLEQAFVLTQRNHPELKRLPLRQLVGSAEVDIAAQAPALVVGVELENVLGSGEFRAADSADFSLTLGSLFEPAARRQARQTLAQSRLAGLDLAAEGQRLDLMAEVARRYLEALAAQAESQVLADSVTRHRAMAIAAARRVQAGAAPEAVRLGAEAALARAELEHARTLEDASAARRRLALMWGRADPDFQSLTGDLLVLPDTPEFATLAALIERTPELQRFAGETRIREARLQLAQAQSRPDLEWQVGLRRLQGSEDWALMGGLSLPLGSRQRAQPAIRAAQAELEELALDREAGALSLYATLAQAHARLRVDALSVQRSGDILLPLLERAERSAGKAYRAGALSYLEWAQLQLDLLTARRDRIAAAHEFHRALIEIQRLTAEPFVLADDTFEETTP